MKSSKWEILLACCKSEYEIIKKKGIKPSSGLRGVSIYKKRWRSVIYVNKKQFFLGTFGSPEEAYLVYQKSRINQILNE